MGLTSLLPRTGVTVIDGILFSGFILVAVLGGTSALTHCRYWLQSRGNSGRFEGREPLTLPYSVPWLGGFFRMMDPHGMYAYAR